MGRKLDAGLVWTGRTHWTGMATPESGLLPHHGLAGAQHLLHLLLPESHARLFPVLPAPTTRLSPGPTPAAGAARPSDGQGSCTVARACRCPRPLTQGLAWPRAAWGCPPRSARTGPRNGVAAGGPPGRVRGQGGVVRSLTRSPPHGEGTQRTGGEVAPSFPEKAAETRHANSPSRSRRGNVQQTR